MPVAMKLSRFPLPQHNNSMGVHLGLNLTDRNIRLDLDRCLEMGMSWAMIANPDPDILIETAQLFWWHDIMPVLRPIVYINRGFGWKEFTKKATDALGFPPYIQIYNEPSDHREWHPTRKKKRRRPKEWLDVFASQWHRVANEVAVAGGLPGLQVLTLTELRAVLEDGFHAKAWLCSHNYGFKLPPDYYAKGDDYSLGVLSFLNFADVFREELGYVPPIICGESGWFFGGVGNEQHAEWTTEMFLPFRDGELPNEWPTPDYLLACCPWILSGYGQECWHDNKHNYCRAPRTVEAIKEISDFERGEPRPEPKKNWRVVSPWMIENEALEDLATLAMVGFPDYEMEERD